MRPGPFLVAIISAAPAFAQQAAPDAPRYEVAPGDPGFTRIDMQTGVVSHCMERDGIWTCEPALASPAALDRLSDQLNGLSERVDGIAERLGKLEPKTPAAGARRPALATEAVGRLLEMVRRLKRLPARGTALRPTAP